MIVLNKNSTLLSFIIAAYENLGGRARPGPACREVARLLKINGLKLPNELADLVRRTIDCHCAQSEGFRDTGELFRKCGSEYQLNFEPDPKLDVAWAPFLVRQKVE